MSLRVGLAAFLAALLAWRFSFAIHVFAPVKLPQEYFSGFQPGSNAQCKVLHSPDQRMGYCEDVAFWDVVDNHGTVKRRDVIASCDVHRKRWNTVMGPLLDPEPRGSLWLVRHDSDGRAEETMDNEETNAEEVVLEGYPDGKDFHPIGIAVWPASENDSEAHGRMESNMFVVNHGRYNSTIELFVLFQDTHANADAHVDARGAGKPSARYVRTITHSLLLSPNALALTSLTSFYVTNDHLFTRRLPGILGKTLPVLETMLGLPGGSLLHVDVGGESEGRAGRGRDASRTRVDIAKFGIPFPNGIALSHDGKTLAVASSSYAVVYTYNRTKTGPTREKLIHTHTISVPFAPDNLHYDDTASLLVAGHANFPHLIAVAGNKSEKGNAPSWALEITPNVALNADVDANTLRETLHKEDEDSDEDADPELSDSRMKKTMRNLGSWFVFPFSSAKTRLRRAQASTSGYALRTVYQSHGAKYGSSSTAIRDSRLKSLGGKKRGGTVFVAGLYEHGLLMCRPSA